MASVGGAVSLDVLVELFVSRHGASGTEYTIQRHLSNLGHAVEIVWSETVWAWLWIETDPMEFAAGWPGGSVILQAPRICNKLARHVAALRKDLNRYEYL